MSATHERRRLPCLLGASLLAAALAATGGCGGSSSSPPAPPPPPPAVTLHGVVRGGSQPIAGATVTVYAAGNRSHASASSLGQATSGSDGSFSIGLRDAPVEGSLLYFVARDSNNTASALLAVAGPWCSGSGACGFPAKLQIDALTTVAGAYAFAGLSSADGGTIAGPPGAVASALAAQGNLINLATGGAAPLLANLACTGNGEPANCVALRRLDTMADIIAACAEAGSASAAACTDLMAATGGAADTLAAAAALASQPAVRAPGAALFALLPEGGAYQPVLDAAPGDWTMALIFDGGGLDQPTGVAVDGKGNVWVADYVSPGAVSEFAPDGSALSPAVGITGGGLKGPNGIAVDSTGNVWAANWNGGDGTSVSEFAPDGAPLSGASGFEGGGMLGPIALAVAPDGTVWVANYGNSSATRLSADGTASGPFAAGDLEFPVSIAVDNLGDVWIANLPANSVTELDGSGQTIAPPYTGGGLNEPSGVALTPDGNPWVTDFGTNAVTVLVGGNTPPVSCPSDPGAGDSGCPLSPPGGYTGGGLAGPNLIAMDAAGHAFVSNFHGASISELGADGSALSPPGGYTGAALLQPYGVALDSAGNLWVTDFGSDALAEFIGIAAATRTPIISAITNGFTPP